MSDLEKNAQEEATKKHPYNLREKKEKKAAYRSLIRPELADELYDRILNIIVVQKKYRDPNYSAKDLAKEGQKINKYTPSENQDAKSGKKGKKVGIAYELDNGEIIYVPEE